MYEFELARNKNPKQVDKETYNCLFRCLMKIPGIGKLSANHIISLAAIIGIIPLPFFSVINGRAYKFYDGLVQYFKRRNERIDDPSHHYHLPPRDEVVDNVGYLAMQLFGYEFILERNRENVSCKGGHLLSGFDERYWDIWEGRFDTFEINKNATQIIFPTYKHDGPMLTFENGTWSSDISFPVLINKKKHWMSQFEF